MPVVWPDHEREPVPDEPRPDLTSERLGPALRAELEKAQRIRDNRKRKAGRG